MALLGAVVAVLGTAGRVMPALAAKAELARIGRPYVTQSMLVFDHETGCYDASATPSTGREALFDHYARLARGDFAPDRGEHADFSGAAGRLPPARRRRVSARLRPPRR